MPRVVKVLRIYMAIVLPCKMCSQLTNDFRNFYTNTRHASTYLNAYISHSDSKHRHKIPKMVTFYERKKIGDILEMISSTSRVYTT